jgi:hypothetical protein
LLTSHQGDNYLRFADGVDDEHFESSILTLKPNEKRFCLNYQQAFAVTFGKVDSKKFFNNNQLYQQHVENFKNYHIDISNELE